MIGHLGPRVSALLDGQLPPAEAERAWAHVHRCHVCRDAVEREGWVKTRLAGLGGTAAPPHLKGSLLAGAGAPLPTVDLSDESSRRTSLVVVGGSAVGVALLGVLAVGLTVGSDAPPADRRPPVTNLSGSESARPSPSPGPLRLPDGVLTPGP